MFVHFETQNSVEKVHDLKIVLLIENNKQRKVSFET